MERTFNWDIFCKVIDNFGDIGVCWRLAHDLATRGHRVHFWVDDPSALRWMAPEGHPRIDVLHWVAGKWPRQLHPDWQTDVVLEGFGCDPDPAFLEELEKRCQASSTDDTTTTQVVAKRNCPLWINLEYLSAEAFVARNHGLASMSCLYPLLGRRKYFFYPGFTPNTGGLIREPWVATRRAAFQRQAFLTQHGIATPPAQQVWISMFCYQTAPLHRLFKALVADLQATNNPAGQNPSPHPGFLLLVAQGQAQAAVKDYLSQHTGSANGRALNEAMQRGQIAIHALPWLTQTQFDEVLWACDLNFVRGEDSLVRAIWAEKPFVWQLYPQDPSTQMGKLDAFLDHAALPSSWRDWMRVWNSPQTHHRSHIDAARSPLPALGANLPEWQSAAKSLAETLATQTDLTSRLLRFVAEKR
jgi:uncharacterized repeat protein (TIGR03837 family)